MKADFRFEMPFWGVLWCLLVKEVQNPRDPRTAFWLVLALRVLSGLTSAPM